LVKPVVRAVPPDVPKQKIRKPKMSAA
jgi:hypothetical protein